MSLIARLVGLLLLVLLIGCRTEYVESSPYFAGTFVGHYLTDENATPVGMRIQTEVTDVERKRYTLSGTAMLGDETYTVEGYELAEHNLDYITVQAPPPPRGRLVVNLEGANGAFAYSLCATVYYSSDRIDTPYTFDGLALFEKESPEPYECSYEEQFAAVTLEKLRP